jgi:capping protein alpha
MSPQVSLVSAYCCSELTYFAAAIKTLTGDQSLKDIGGAYQKYNEGQFTTVKLPGSSKLACQTTPVASDSDVRKAIVSNYNTLGDGRYYDVETSTSFAFDHPSQTASDVRSHALESTHSDLM